MLTINALHAYYGKSVLHGVNMRVAAGEIVSLLGRNGAGRSTRIRTVMGLVTGAGSVRYKGEELLGKGTFDISRRGICYVPENRDIFPTMTVD
jgi:branched-chain amino acid transport system ATP-binding protein